MDSPIQQRIATVARLAIAMAPWVIAMYLFYWLESSGTWTPDTPHRGKLSVLILGAGMGLSFLIQSYFTRRPGN